jgi:Recombination endonuclease VII
MPLITTPIAARSQCFQYCHPVSTFVRLQLVTAKRATAPGTPPVADIASPLPEEVLCFCGSPVRGSRRRFCSLRCQELQTRAAGYGIDAAEYTRLLRSQENACAICQRPFLPEVLTPVIDHNHATGKVRGLVCQPCNMRIGFIDRGREDALRDRKFAARVLPYLAAGRV